MRPPMSCSMRPATSTTSLDAPVLFRRGGFATPASHMPSRWPICAGERREHCSWPEFDRTPISISLTATSSEFGPDSANLGRVRPTLGDFRQAWARLDKTSTTFELGWTTTGQMWTKFGTNFAMPADIRQIRLVWTASGPLPTESGRFRPKLSLARPENVPGPPRTTQPTSWARSRNWANCAAARRPP